MEQNIIMYKGRITKVIKYAKQDNVLIQGIKGRDQVYYDSSNRYAGSNGTYIKFGDYHGMCLDITCSLYDTDKKIIEIDNKKFKMSGSSIVLDVYKETMELLGMKRMPSKDYDKLLELEGQKCDFFIGILEDTLQIIGGLAMVDVGVMIKIPKWGGILTVNNEELIVRQKVYLVEVK